MTQQRLPSRAVTEGMQNALHRMYYYAMGLSAEEIHRPQIGVVTAPRDASGTDRDMDLLAYHAKMGAAQQGATGRQFSTVAGDVDVQGGDSKTTSPFIGRELVADSIELAVRGHCYDGLVAFCSSYAATMGASMAALRLDLPAVVVVSSSGPQDTRLDVARAVVDGLGLGISRDPGTPAEGARSAGRLVTDRLRGLDTARTLVTRSRLVDLAASLGSMTASPSHLLQLLAIINEAGMTLPLEDLAAAYQAAADGTRLAVLHGSLAPGGCLAAAPSEAPDIKAPARVYNSEQEACRSVAEGEVASTDVLVLRYQGSVAGPGAHCLDDLARLLERGPSSTPRALVTDGTLPTVQGVACIQAITPEAGLGGPLAVLADGDTIAVRFSTATIDMVHNGQPAEPPIGTVATSEEGAVIWKYRRLVGPVVNGALTQPGAASKELPYFWR
jgi:dihydroxyacid dehydratase/phosphogluconate dehydratase